MAVHNLILFRHAKAEDPFDAPSDEERALTGAGKAAALTQLSRLKELGCMPDVALVSPSTRTRQTWGQAAEIFPQTDVKVVDGLYLASPRTIADVIKAHGGYTTLVVGHNPGIHMLACDLMDATDRSLQAGKVKERFKTAEIAWFIADDESRSDYMLLHFLTRDR